MKVKESKLNTIKKRKIKEFLRIKVDRHAVGSSANLMRNRLFGVPSEALLVEVDHQLRTLLTSEL